METFDDTPQDVTKTGPIGLKGLPGINDSQSTRTREDALNDLRLGVRSYTPRDYGRMYSDYEHDETNPNGYGSSRFDPNFITPYQLENLEDTRAQRQSNLSKITNGIIKGITTTGTTFANGTVGLVWGLGQGVVNALDGDENTSFASGLWNNQFNQWMNQANEWMEQVAPNYYTNDEREHPMSHIFNANFIGDKFIKNLGFTAGALGSAVAFGGAYGKLGHLLGKAALGLGTTGRTAVGISKAASMGIGAVAAATTEGSIEALQAAQQMGEENQQLYTNLRDSNIQEIMDNPNLNDYEKELLIEDENDKYSKIMAKLEEDKAKVGNATLAWNIPILTAGNIIQFNKLLGGGFRSASRAAKVAGKMGEMRPGGLFEKTAVQRAAKALYKSGHTEGREEVLQQLASDVSNTRYSLELNDYYKSLYDPEANTQASDYIAGMGKQILATLGREDTWEQYLIGSMTGVMGAPVFGKKNTQTRADFGKGKRIGWSGGVLGQYKEITEDRERNQRVAEYLNERAKDPKFRDQYQRLVRHMYFQDKMDAALDEGLEKEFKDSEFAQLYNDIMWFTYAGKKDVLRDMVSGALNNITDEEAAEIVKDTTKTVTNEEGKEVTTGPFIGADGNPMTPDQIREKVAKSKNDVLNLMQKIEDEYDALDNSTNGKLSDEQLEQLTYMKLQIDDWRERTKSVGEDIGNFFESIVKEFQTRLDSNKAILEASPNNETAKHNVDVLEKNIKVMQEIATTLKGFTALERMGVADHQQARKIFGQAIRNLDKIDQRGIDQDQKAKVTTGLQDLIKMSQSSEIFQKRRDQYLKNPDLMLNDRDDIIKQMEKEELEERANKQMQNLTSAENIEAFDKAVNDSDDDEAMQQAIDDLASSGNTMARQYKSNQAIAQRQKEKVRSLIGTEIPTLNGGTMTVSQEDAEAVEAIIDNRRLNTNPAEKDGTSFINTEQMTNPFLDDMNGLWESGLGIDTATEEGIARSKRIQDIFHYVATQAKEDETTDDVIDDEDLDFDFDESSEPASDETTGADGVSTVPPTTTTKPGIEEIVNNIVNHQVDIPYGTTTWDESTKSTRQSQGKSKIIDIAGRKVIVLNVGGFNIPFYLSTGSGGKKTVPAGKWYPFFGISEDGNWLNKLHEEDINNYYGSDALRQICQALDNLYGDIRSDNSIPKVAPSQISLSLAVINKDITPTENELPDTAKIVEANVAKVKQALENYKPTTSKPTAPVTEPEIAPTTSEDLKKQREESLKDDPEKTLPKDGNGRFVVWKNNIPQYDVEYKKDKKEYVAPGPKEYEVGEDGKRHGKIKQNADGTLQEFETHKILAKLGAFEYVNLGKLKPGDKVKFVIDPSYAKDIQDDSIRQQVEGAIWIVSAKDNQVIGILPQDRNTMNKYAGLAEFSDSLVQQWRDGGKQRLESSVTTEVQDLKAGFVPYIEEEKDLSEVMKTGTPKFTAVEETTAFGVKKTLRVSIPSVTGKTVNPLVKIKNFDSTLLGDAKFKSSKLYRDFYNEVQNVIRKIQDNHRDFTAITDDEAKELLDVISNYIYTSPRKANALHINHSTSSRGGVTLRVSGQNRIVDIFKVRESNLSISIGGEVSEPSVNGGTFMSTDKIVGDIMTELAGFGMPIQVAFSQVGNQAYMKDRFDAGVLTSNLESVSLYDEWYTLKPVTEVNGKWQMSGQEKVKTEEAAGERAAAAVEAASEPETPSVPEVTGTPTPKRPEQKRKPARRVRAVDRKTWKRMKQEEEIAWLEKALPQVTAENRLKFTKGLIDVAEMGKEAWGLFDKGIVTISDVAAEGTIYHEAFHTVFNMILSEDEKQALFNSAKKLWPSATDNIDLEERLAEEFRRYVMHRQDNTRPKNLGARIANFFAQLWEKVKNWYSPTMYNYFAKINEGYYADAELRDTDTVRARDYVQGIQSEEDAYNRIMDLWNHPWGTTIYKDRNGKRHDVKVIGRGPKGIEFRFPTEREAIDFQDWWWDQVDASFSPIWYDRENDNYRVYMHKPGMISQEEAAERERLSAHQQTEYDKLSDDEKETLKSRGYSAEDFNSLSDTEQQAVKECFFVL